MSVLIVIPARFASTRYPGKPLVELVGATGIRRSLIERSWIAAKSVTGVSRVVVATDDERIQVAANEFGAEVVMTSSECRNGTERCAEVSKILGGEYELVVNLQGDAPLTPPWFVEALIDALREREDDGIATPVLRCNGKTLEGFRNDRRNGRVGGTTAVFNCDGSAMYFSKEVIPYCIEDFAPDAATPVFHHVGVYAYRREVLEEYPTWPLGHAEALEGLEQLRFLERGKRIACVEVDARGRHFWELNNPDDVKILESMMVDMDLP